MSVKPVILVTGSNGQLGSELQELETVFADFQFVFLSREDLPINHTVPVEQAFAKYQPQYLINCAAYTAVDKAESEKELAFEINGAAVGVLTAACKKNNCRFIHISTDYVFDGTASEPYPIDAPVNPQSVYGASKLEGEIQAFSNNEESIIIRTSWVYSSFGKNFVKTMMKLMAEREELNVVNDQIGQPTYAADLAQAIMTIIANCQLSVANWKPGIYHFSNTGIISWFDFAVAIKELTGSSCRINPIPTTQYPTPAKRPAYSVLDTSAIVTAFGIELKEWKESLRICIMELKNNLPYR